MATFKDTPRLKKLLAEARAYYKQVNDDEKRRDPELTRSKYPHELQTLLTCCQFTCWEICPALREFTDEHVESWLYGKVGNITNDISSVPHGYLTQKPLDDIKGFKRASGGHIYDGHMAMSKIRDYCASASVQRRIKRSPHGAHTLEDAGDMDDAVLYCIVLNPAYFERHGAFWVALSEFLKGLILPETSRRTQPAMWRIAEFYPTKWVRGRRPGAPLHLRGTKLRVERCLSEEDPSLIESRKVITYHKEFARLVEHCKRMSPQFRKRLRTNKRIHKQNYNARNAGKPKSAEEEILHDDPKLAFRFRPYTLDRDDCVTAEMRLGYVPEEDGFFFVSRWTPIRYNELAPEDMASPDLHAHMLESDSDAPKSSDEGSEDER